MITRCALSPSGGTYAQNPYFCMGLVNAAEALLNKGAKAVYAYATHGVLSGGAVARIRDSKLKSLVITDSIAATEEITKCKNIRRISTPGVR